MLARQFPMAELHSTRPRGVAARARRRGFVAFCAVLSALIATLLLHPFAAAADRPTPRRAAAGRLGGPSRPAAATDPIERTPDPDPGASRGIDRIPRPTFDRLLAAGEPIRCGAGTEPLVALTFDDGPGVLTRETVELLRARGMTATFFLVGKLLDESRFEGLPRLAARLGAVGDHTWDHVPMAGASHEAMDEQIARTRRAIAVATGEPVGLFRPPLGARDDRLDDYVGSLGMLTVLWSLESADSQGASADRIVREIRAGLSAGDIVLLHENRGTTQRALPRILDLVGARGLTTVTVPELLARDPPTDRQLRLGTCPA